MIDIQLNSADHSSFLSLMSQIENSNPVETNQKDLVIEKLDDLQRSISVRKVEISEICLHEKLAKPDFTDLNWVIEQIYWLKKTL